MNQYRCETCNYFPAGSIFDSRCPYSEFTWRHAGNYPQCIKDPFLASEIWQVPIDVMSELTSFIGCASHSDAKTIQCTVCGSEATHPHCDICFGLAMVNHRQGEREKILDVLESPIKELLKAIGSTYKLQMAAPGDYNCELGEAIQVCFDKFRLLEDVRAELRQSKDGE